jgi:hypothetical protein
VSSGASLNRDVALTDDCVSLDFPALADGPEDLRDGASRHRTAAVRLLTAEVHPSVRVRGTPALPREPVAMTDFLPKGAGPGAALVFNVRVGADLRENPMAAAGAALRRLVLKFRSAGGVLANEALPGLADVWTRDAMPSLAADVVSIVVVVVVNRGLMFEAAAEPYPPDVSRPVNADGQRLRAWRVENEDRIARLTCGDALDLDSDRASTSFIGNRFGTGEAAPMSPCRLSGTGRADFPAALRKGLRRAFACPPDLRPSDPGAVPESGAEIGICLTPRCFIDFLKESDVCGRDRSRRTSPVSCPAGTRPRQHFRSLRAQDSPSATYAPKTALPQPTRP